MIGIYKITNIINGKVYIGQADDINRRWYHHKYYYQVKDNLIYRAMRKYGIENFSFEVIEECSIEALDEREIYYIEQYNSYINAEKSNGYNATLGGSTSRGYRHTEETKEKIREKKKGKKLSEETKRKIGEALKGKNNFFYNKHFIGEENSMYGKHHSEESKQKMSKSHKGKKLTQEHKDSLKEARKGGKNPRARKVICEGIVFNCIKDCAEHYGINRKTMTDWLLGRHSMKQEFIEKELSYYEELGGEIKC